VTIPIAKYPRTRHVEGSRLQPGDHDLDAVPVRDLVGQNLVIEEKLDGANAGISFGPGRELRLQSRGHYLTGGHRERHFALFKTWANAHRRALWELLGERYLLYGEWLYAKHTIFYDRLPHYFLEFDLVDRETGLFLATDRRHALLAGGPVRSVPVLWTGAAEQARLPGLITTALYKSARWRERLAEVAAVRGLDRTRVAAETDSSDEMEGLYIKAEHDGRVVGRYKYVRASFLTSVVDSGSHWLDRPIVPNQLAPGVDLFGQSAEAAPS
jgi:hypothetical protein